MDRRKSEIHYGFERPDHGGPDDVWILPLRDTPDGRTEENVIHVWRDGDWYETRPETP